LIGHPSHGGDHDDHIIAGVDLELEVARYIADAVEIGDRRSAEFHHEPSHDVPVRAERPYKATGTKAPRAGLKRRVYIPVGSPRCNNGRHPYNEIVCMVTGKARMSSVDTAEVERFSRHAADWWNPRGPMAALHKFNPIRLAYIRD